MRAATAALAPLEVAVGRGRAALARFEGVLVHPQAHGAAGGAPLEAGSAEALVEALGLGLAADGIRARDDHGAHVGVHLPTGEHRGGGPQVADAAVGAGADEDA